MPLEECNNCSVSTNSGKYRAFEGANQLTYLADKVCRLKEDDLAFKDDKLSAPVLTVTESTYMEVIKQISNFMALPNNEPNV